MIYFEYRFKKGFLKKGYVTNINYDCEQPIYEMNSSGYYGHRKSDDIKNEFIDMWWIDPEKCKKLDWYINDILENILKTYYREKKFNRILCI